MPADTARYFPDPERLRRLLLPAEPAFQTSTAPQAAVLVLPCPGGKEPVVLLTLRSEDLPLHPGQIRLPGGRVQQGDASLEATALREANEETGLDPTIVEVLGRLPVTQVASSGYDITPVVAMAMECPHWHPCPREVRALIELPLRLALDPDAYRRDSLVRNGVTREFDVLDYEAHYIWGATARVLLSLACRLAGKDGGSPAEE